MNHEDSFQSVILCGAHIPRLQNIITLFVWNYTRRGLLDSDKLTVVSMMCMNILVRVRLPRGLPPMDNGNLSPKGSWSPHHNPLVRPGIFSGGRPPGIWRGEKPLDSQWSQDLEDDSLSELRTFRGGTWPISSQTFSMYPEWSNSLM